MDSCFLPAVTIPVMMIAWTGAAKTFLACPSQVEMREAHTLGIARPRASYPTAQVVSLDLLVGSRRLDGPVLYCK